MFVGKGWTVEEATADAHTQAEHKTGTDVGTFSVYREVTVP